MLFQKFDPLIYPYKLWILIDPTPTQISKHFVDYDGLPINFDELPDDVDAFVKTVICKKSSNMGVIIYFRYKKSMTYGTVAHECTHAAKLLFKHIGADINPFEPFEYLIGWMASCCEQIKKKKS